MWLKTTPCVYPAGRSLCQILILANSSFGVTVELVGDAQSPIRLNQEDTFLAPEDIAEKQVLANNFPTDLPKRFQVQALPKAGSPDIYGFRAFTIAESLLSVSPPWTNPQLGPKGA
jgi:hypothetical protein